MEKQELKEFFSDFEEFCRSCSYECFIRGMQNCPFATVRGMAARTRQREDFLDKLALPTDGDYEIIRKIKKPRRYPRI
jgi:hypothetical protein